MYVWDTKRELQETVTLTPGTVATRPTIRHGLDGTVSIFQPVDLELMKRLKFQL
jgi:hypothetical protein